MLSKELVSVILPARNAAKVISRAISSIQQQTHQFVELIVIVDPSQDNTEQIVRNFAKNDQRIKVEIGQNQGLSSALNQGLDLSRGSYIARMDADDYSLPSRLEFQLNEINERDLHVCGTQFSAFDKLGRHAWTSELPLFHDEIVAWMCTNSPICHPSAMIESKFLKSRQIKYGKQLYSEDYHLWVKMAGAHARFGNTQEPLLEYRLDDSSASNKFAAQSICEGVKAARNHLKFNNNLVQQVFVL